MKGRERSGKRPRDKGPCRLCEGLSLCTENSGMVLQSFCSI